MVCAVDLTGQCPDDWYGSDYVDTCFKTFTDDSSKAAFSNASAVCQNSKGSLALPYDNTSTWFILDGFKDYGYYPQLKITRLITIIDVTKLCHGCCRNLLSCL